jgi:predicted RNase H-like HicB family nuclease
MAQMRNLCALALGSILRMLAPSLPLRERRMIAVRTPGTRFEARDECAGPAPRRSDSLRQVMLIRAEGGYWVAECPSLPGCHGEGRTRERAIESVKEAIASHLTDLEEAGLAVPEERFDALLVVV